MGTNHDLVDGAETLEIPTQGENLRKSKFEQNTFIFFLERWSTFIQFSASFSSMSHERSPHQRNESSVSLTIFDKLVSSFTSKVTNKTHCPIAPALRYLATTSAAASTAASARCSCEEGRSGRTLRSDADCDGLRVTSRCFTNSAANCLRSNATHQHLLTPLRSLCRNCFSSRSDGRRDCVRCFGDDCRSENASRSGANDDGPNNSANGNGSESGTATPNESPNAKTSRNANSANANGSETPSLSHRQSIGSIEVS